MSLLSRLHEVVVRVGPLGFVAFGGPAINIILFRRLFVLSDRPWLDSTTFADLFSLSGALPGPGSTQLLFSIGLIRGGVLPGLLCFFLFSLPGAVAMFLIALGVSKLPSTLPPIALAGLTGLNASAVGLIFYAALQLSRSTSTTHTTRLILLGVAAISSCYSSIWLFPVLTLNGGVVTLIADWSGWRRFGSKLKRKPAESGADRIDTAASIALEEVGLPGRPAGPSTPPTHITRLPSPPPSPNLLEAPSLRRRPNNSLPIASPVEDTTTTLDAPTSINLNVTILQAGMVLALFFTIIITVVVLRATMREQSRGLQLFTNLYIAGSILFGGGPAVVPLLQGYIVAPGWVSSKDFLIGFALLSALPGPNFNFAIFLGALSMPHAPVLGAVLGYVSIFTPGLLLKFALLPTCSRFRHNRSVRVTLTGLNSAATGLIWTASFRLWKVGLLTQGSKGASLEKSGFWISVAGAAFLASESFVLPAPVVVLGGAVAGLCYGGLNGAP